MSKETGSNQKEIREISGFSIEVLIDEVKIRERLVIIADQIYEDYYKKGKNPIFICVLRGAEPTYIWLTQELGRENPKTDRKPVSAHGGHIGLSSYGKSKNSSGRVKLTSRLSVDIEGEDVIIVEDILDSGNTMTKARKKYFFPKKPKSLEIFALLDKVDGRVFPIEAKYVGFKIPNKFVVGFGLDLNETELRNLPWVGVPLLEP
ncbi:MAG: phosphoribosyltransferase family protein [Patescibacteria group bacterium]|nr:hypoxanthine phosphoribosyltransferase [Patescibacteria group bacterium]MBU2036005.1 hypoxanthine phosphoribosyltransferase [Patescibacteria group bacterium]